MMMSSPNILGQGIKGTISHKRAFFKNQINELFSTFLQGVARIVQLAGDTEFRNRSLDNITDHPAHIGLLVAFVRMLKVLQDDLNLIP